MKHPQSLSVVLIVIAWSLSGCDKPQDAAPAAVSKEAKPEAGAKTTTQAASPTKGEAKKATAVEGKTKTGAAPGQGGDSKSAEKKVEGTAPKDAKPGQESSDEETVKELEKTRADLERKVKKTGDGSRGKLRSKSSKANREMNKAISGKGGKLAPPKNSRATSKSAKSAFDELDNQ